MRTKRDNFNPFANPIEEQERLDAKRKRERQPRKPSTNPDARYNMNKKHGKV